MPENTDFSEKQKQFLRDLLKGWEHKIDKIMCKQRPITGKYIPEYDEDGNEVVYLDKHNT